MGKDRNKKKRYQTTSTGCTTTDETSTGCTTTDKTSTGCTATGKTSTGCTTTGKTSTGKHKGKGPKGKGPKGKGPKGKRPKRKTTSTGKTSTGCTTTDETVLQLVKQALVNIKAKVLKGNDNREDRANKCFCLINHPLIRRKHLILK
ncbi:hypothetical protein [Domibacillus mangrovi]|uniref:hypothetical protein n=1 Tax=Domibacillus mangrovi TaxID=1714354 RepID=UPI000A4E7CD0|nr:hypothetical protein [Domibacillus mangrovi]